MPPKWYFLVYFGRSNKKAAAFRFALNGGGQRALVQELQQVQLSRRTVGAVLRV